MCNESVFCCSRYTDIFMQRKTIVDGGKGRILTSQFFSFLQAIF